MNKLSWAIIAILSLSACKKESVEVIDITKFHAYIVSEILDVKDVQLTQQIPDWYVPESCETQQVPWAYADPAKMITNTVTQITCTQKYGPKQYIPSSLIGPVNGHIFGIQEVREFTLRSQDAQYPQYTLLDTRWEVRAQVWSICDYMYGRLYNCKER